MAFLSRLRRRNLQPEWMDRPDLDEGQHRHALHGLERINWWSASARIFWPSLAALARETPDRPCRVLDVATGGGDVLCGLWRRSQRAGLPFVFEGCDISPVALTHARKRAAERKADISFFSRDVLHDPIPPGYDAVICSLFLHHLTEEQAIALLRRMGEAGRLVLVNDLARSRVGYVLAWAGTRILSRCPVVHFDGPRSVEGAFTPDEALALARAAAWTGPPCGDAGRSDTCSPVPAREHGESPVTVPATLGLDDAAASCWEVIVAGAGPAGSLAARQLARGGLRVLLVDRASFPRWKVCGCCLNGSALATLHSVGLGGLVERCGGVSLSRVCLGAGHHSAVISLPCGRALSREAFDTALLQSAIDAGAAFLPRAQARALPHRRGDERPLRLQGVESEATLATRLLLVADGLGGRVLADEPGCLPVAAPGSRVGAGTVMPAAPSFFAEGTIYMACGEGGYVGLVRLEDGRLDVAAALDPWLIRRQGGPGAAVCSILSRLDWPPVPGLANASWRGTPALTRSRPRLAGPRFFVLGDAASYVEPFTGEGMAWALASAAAVTPLAVEAVRRWRPDLISRWHAVHRRVLGPRRRWCRAVTLALRRPLLVSIAVRLLARMPFLAAPLVHRLNTEVHIASF